MNQSLLDKARSWLEQDPDPETRAELENLIAQNNEVELAARFSGRIGFGTAGLRGPLGAGPTRMNRVLVSQAAAGLANYLRKKYQNPSVVIGFDARMKSREFAENSAKIFAGFDIKTYLFDDLAATPLVAFAVKELGCSLGVMVTASHNPRGDNGYKVYDDSGAQIVSPTDAEIASAIEQFAAKSSLSELKLSEDYQATPEFVKSSYLETIANLASGSSKELRLKVVYSAMHGVGSKFINGIFDRIGWPRPIQVAEQSQPDGRFPTLPFPNPEEKGATDLAIAEAKKSSADLVLVNDPDSDRLAVIYKTKSGNFQMLSGDELGIILGEEMAKRAQSSGRQGNLACSIVSSSALEKVAKHYGLGFEQTLTGFKWISRVPNLIFGYEEALGYCVDWQSVRDKDGLSAAVVITDIANRLSLQGKDLGDELSDIRKRDGYFLTSQISIRVQELSEIARLMEKVRASSTLVLAGMFASVIDYLVTGKLPASDAVELNFPDGRRVIIRPSGTEPKLKCYLQAVHNEAEEARAKLTELEIFMTEFLS